MTFLENLRVGFARPVIHYKSRTRLPQTNGRLKIKGLTAEVIVHRDQWGIPHIQAHSRTDMLMAQGVVHAQDRLWQMDLNRRVATGTAAAVLGIEALALDRLARTLGFARLAQATWPKLATQAQEDLQAYTAGVNTYLQTAAALPVEFDLLKYSPQLWTVLDSLAIGRLHAWAMNRGWSHELVRSQLRNLVSDELLQEIEPYDDSTTPLTTPHGIEINATVKHQILTEASGQLLGKGTAEGSGLGSNAWVVAPALTTTGHSILANDVHLPLTVPSIWYHMHQQYENGYNVSGVSMPGNPHIVIGHNAHIAWGMTLAYTDTEDLFVEKLHPEDPTLYEFQNEWQPLGIITELIEIKDQPTHTEQVRITRHGPLVNGSLLESEEPIALQATSLQDNYGAAGLLALNDAQNWEQFKTAVRFIEAPALNILYADQQGNIGHYVSGLVPLRPPGKGQLPAAGWTGTAEWHGFIPFEEMPHQLNPERGYIVSCNHKLVDENYPHFLGACWMGSYRAQRLEQLITAAERIAVTDCQQWQQDVHSLPAESLLSHLADLQTSDPDALVSLKLLRQWDKTLVASSAAAAVYELFLHKLVDAIFEPLLGSQLMDRLWGHGFNPVIYPVSEFYSHLTSNLLRMFDNSNSAWLPSGIGREVIVVRCLRETTAALHELLGRNPALWEWGKLHQLRFSHALSAHPILNRVFTLGPVASGGDTDTVLQAAVLPSTTDDPLIARNAFSVTYRQIIDLSGWDHSIAMHAPGQSGHVASPHYSDLIKPWQEGTYYPLAFTKAAVQRIRRQTLTLVS